MHVGPSLVPVCPPNRRLHVVFLLLYSKLSFIPKTPVVNFSQSLINFGKGLTSANFVFIRPAVFNFLTNFSSLNSQLLVMSLKRLDKWFLLTFCMFLLNSRAYVFHNAVLYGTQYCGMQSPSGPTPFLHHFTQQEVPLASTMWCWIVRWAPYGGAG